MEVTGDNVSNVDIQNEIISLCREQEKISTWDGSLTPKMEQPNSLNSLKHLQDTEVTSGQDEESEIEEEVAPLNYELQQGERILYELMLDTNKHFNWPFMDAVDSSVPELSDYYERVKSPMWLRKMKEKFDNRQYETITEFVADFRLMLENCFRYNGPDHYVSKRAQRLETMLEQKLALLSRELREKTTIEATSGSGNVSSNKGLRRRGVKPIIPHDSSNLLNQLREEEARRARELRQNMIAERKAVTEAWLNDMQGWEDKLLAEPYRTYMKAMWELPQIGLFLFLCQAPLNLMEVTQFELERCFAMAKQSSTLQWTMTSLLSTPFQRTKIDKKNLMPYSVWNEKLTMRVSIWYKALDDAKGDAYAAASKLGIDVFFFEVAGKKNPLLKKKFHELSFYRKVWIMKTLCDHCLESQESLRDAIEFQPPADQHEYILGWDAKGNSYLHFPQFCGADVRIYRQAPLPEPDTGEEEIVEVKSKDSVKDDYTPPIKKKKKTSGCFGRRKRGSQVKKIKKSLQEDECTDTEETEDNSELSSAPPSRSLTATPEVNDPDSDSSSLSSSWSILGPKQSESKTGLARKLQKQFDTTCLNEKHSVMENTQIENWDADMSESNVTNGIKQGTSQSDDNEKACNNLRALNIDSARNISRVNNAKSVSNMKDKISDEKKITSEDHNNCTNASEKTECEKMDYSDNSDVGDMGNIGVRKGNNCDKKLCFQTNKNMKRKRKISELYDINKETQKSSALFESNFILEREQNRKIHKLIKTSVCHTPNSQAQADQEKDKTDKSLLNGNNKPFSKPAVFAENGECEVCDIKLEEESVMCVNDIKQECDLNKEECTVKQNGSVESDVKKISDSEQKENVHTELKGAKDRNDEINNDINNDSVKEMNDEAEHCKIKKENVTGSNSDSEQKFKKDSETETTKPAESEDEHDEITPSVGDFELIVENVQQLREICARFAEPEPISVRRGRKIVKPAQRRKCVIELHERLLFLLNELEPWETKLSQATRRARVKMRKEFENYKEEPPESLKDWDSDKSEEGSSDSEQEDSSDTSEVETKEKKTLKKQPPLPQKTPETSIPEDYEFDVSSRGRLRKRRVIPNNTEDTFCKRKKVVKMSEEISSTANAPNILAKQKHALPVGSVLSSNASQINSEQILESNITSTSHLIHVSVSSSTLSASPSVRGQKVQVLANTSVTQTSHPVIQSLLSVRKPTTVPPVTFRKIQVKGKTNTATTSIYPFTEPGGTQNSLGSPIHILAKPAISAQKTLQLSTLPSGVLQQLLKNKAMRIQTAGGATTILLTAPVKQAAHQVFLQQSSEAVSAGLRECSSLPSQSCQTVISLSLNNQNSTITTEEEAGHYETVTSPTSTFPFKVPLSSSIGSPSSSVSVSVLTTNVPGLSPSKQRYANNITVKELLETRVAQGKPKSENSPSEKQSVSSDSVSDSQNVCNDSTTVPKIQNTGHSSLVSGMVKQSVIDTVIKSVVTSVSTTLPTVNIKVPSPVTLPSINLRKNVTKTVQVMKSPIAVTPKLESLIPSATEGSVVTGSMAGQNVLSTQAAAGTQMSFLVPGAVGANPSQKNVVLKGTPQALITSQGVVQGYLTPQGLIIPAGQMPVASGTKVSTAKPVQLGTTQQKNDSSSEAVTRGLIAQTMGQKLDAAQAPPINQNRKSEMVVSTYSTIHSPLASPAVMQSLSAALKLKSQSQMNKNILSTNQVQVASQSSSTVTAPSGKIPLTNANPVQNQKLDDNTSGLHSKIKTGTPAAELMKQIIAGQQGQISNILVAPSPVKQGQMSGLKQGKTEQPAMIPAVIVNQPGTAGSLQKKIVLPLQNIQPNLLQCAVVVSTLPVSSPQTQNVLNSAVKQLFTTEVSPQMVIPSKIITSPVRVSAPSLSANIKVNKLLFQSGQQIQQVPSQKQVSLSAQNVQMASDQQTSFKNEAASKSQVITPQKDGIVQPTRLVLSPQLVAGHLTQLPLGKITVPQSSGQKVIYNLSQGTVLQQTASSGQQTPVSIVGMSPSAPLPGVRFVFPSLQPVLTGTTSKPQALSSTSGITLSDQCLQEVLEAKPLSKPPNAKANHPTLASALLQTSKPLNISQSDKSQVSVTTMQTSIGQTLAAVPALSNTGIPSLKLFGETECNLTKKQIETSTSAALISQGSANLLGSKTEITSKQPSPISNITVMSPATNQPNTGSIDTGLARQQKLMLYNIGGQLMTAQGVPVTVHQGILKVLPQATIQVGSQILTVRAPSSSFVHPVPSPKTTNVANYSSATGYQLPSPSYAVSSNKILPNIQKFGDGSPEVKPQIKNLPTVNAERIFESGQSPNLESDSKTLDSVQVIPQAPNISEDHHHVPAIQKQTVVPFNLKSSLCIIGENKISNPKSSSVAVLESHVSVNPQKLTSSICNTVQTNKINLLSAKAEVTNASDDQQNNLKRPENRGFHCLNSQQSTPTKSREEAALNLLCLASVGARKNNGK